MFLTIFSTVYGCALKENEMKEFYLFPGVNESDTLAWPEGYKFSLIISRHVVEAFGEVKGKIFYSCSVFDSVSAKISTFSSTNIFFLKDDVVTEKGRDFTEVLYVYILYVHICVYAHVYVYIYINIL